MRSNLDILTTAIAGIIDLKSVRPLDGHLFVDRYNADKGTVSGRVLHAHDESVIAHFSISVAV